MTYIWTEGQRYHRAEYKTEAELEAAIVQVQAELFGPNRIYLDVKKKIGVKNVQENVPDGYVIDLSSSSPRLYVVENELAAHEPLRHIAVQILQFSLSFEAAPRMVRNVLFGALQDQADGKAQCERYVKARAYRNLDHLLDHLVHEVPFAALVIIDRLPDNLENVLARKFKFGVDVIEFAVYENEKGERAYRFTPFMQDVAQDISEIDGPPGNKLGLDEIDTVVVPARQDGFEETFIGENCWYAVRLGAAVRPQIKHIAAYQVAPESAITHVANVQSIEPYKDTGKFILKFARPAKKLDGPIKLVKGGKVNAPQNLRYTSLARLKAAKTLDDLW